jgi:hypothetical protein
MSLALRHLLVIRSYQSAENAEYLFPWQSNPVFRCAGCFRLPTEIWGEIAKRLPRSDLRNLMLVPHPLRGIASELFWQEISLQFDIFYDTKGMKDFEIYNVHRSFGIMTKLLRDNTFAHRVQALNVHIGAYVGFDRDESRDAKSEMGELFLTK